MTVIVVTDDINESGITIWKDNCYTVQHLSYKCSRDRNALGVPYGPNLPSLLKFTLKMEASDAGKTFYQRMQTREACPFSFLFNASFTARGSFSRCENALEAKGYIVDMEESNETVLVGEEVQEQMLLKITLRLSHLVFSGMKDNLTLTITND